MIDGSIITARTIIAAKRLAPSGTLNIFLMPGTSTIMPTRPYTTEGMPASSDTASTTTALTRFGAIFDR